jgi:hypothetical protein
MIQIEEVNELNQKQAKQIEEMIKRLDAAYILKAAAEAKAQALQEEIQEIEAPVVELNAGEISRNLKLQEEKAIVEKALQEKVEALKSAQLIVQEKDTVNAGLMAELDKKKKEYTQTSKQVIELKANLEEAQFNIKGAKAQFEAMVAEGEAKDKEIEDLKAELAEAKKPKKEEQKAPVAPAAANIVDSLL